MRVLMMTGALAALLCLAVPVQAAPDEATKQKWEEHTGDLPFVYTYEAGKKEALWSGRPMMVFFTTTW